MYHNSNENKLQDFTREDLAKFREEVCLNSMFYSDFRNSFGINEHSASIFFDSYLSNISELAAEDGFNCQTWEEFLDKYDTIDNLENWHGCYEDWSWVEYVDEEEYSKAA